MPQFTPTEVIEIPKELRRDIEDNPEKFDLKPWDLYNIDFCNENAVTTDSGMSGNGTYVDLSPYGNIVLGNRQYGNIVLTDEQYVAYEKIKKIVAEYKEK